MWYSYDYSSQIAILAMGMVTSWRLRHVPSPLLSKITNMHLAMYDFSYSRNDQILEWHHQYGPIICIGPNEVSVATLEATKEIYSATQRWPKSNYFDNFKGYNRRSILRRTIEQHIQERSQTVLRQIRPGTQVDIYSLADCYALDIITFLVLGPHQCTRSVENVCLERQILMDLKHLQFVGPLRLRCPILFDYVSKLLDTLSPGLAYLRAEDRLASWCQQRIPAAMKDPDFENSRSLLQHILANLQNVGPKQSIDHLYVAAEILDNINAAEATVAHPEWQQKIRKELNALAVQENGLISFADVNGQVPSLEACLREVYRLHPASSGRSERLVPKGGHEEMLNMRLNQLIPFGYGGRVCLGKALATMEIKFLIAGLYRKYKTVMTEASTHASMRQCSTHDAVPWGLQCVIECQLVDDEQ
ncbi:benzoate 4-monooxygenase cytochrome P450 [Trichoderma afarasin]